MNRSAIFFIALLLVTAPPRYGLPKPKSINQLTLPQPITLIYNVTIAKAGRVAHPLIEKSTATLSYSDEKLYIEKKDNNQNVAIVVYDGKSSFLYKKEASQQNATIAICDRCVNDNTLGLPTPGLTMPFISLFINPEFVKYDSSEKARIYRAGILDPIRGFYHPIYRPGVLNVKETDGRLTVVRASIFDGRITESRWNYSNAALIGKELIPRDIDWTRYQDGKPDISIHYRLTETSRTGPSKEQLSVSNYLDVGTIVKWDDGIIKTQFAYFPTSATLRQQAYKWEALRRR
jgi:hypothetical protein